MTSDLNATQPLRAILVHGMGRTPASLAFLALRLRAAGIRPAFFVYVAAIESFPACRDRLGRFIEARAKTGPYILVGHSLGSVLARAALPGLTAPPLACFFLAPPVQASRAARAMAPRRLFRLLTGPMGQHLADADFMQALPIPAVPTTVYAGTRGPRGRWSPFGLAPNDGVLTVAETRLAAAPLVEVRALHTFIMNSRAVARDIVATARALASRVPPPPQSG